MENKDECGSTFLLAKACHDIDLVCWLNNSTKPLYVSSFGGRRFIVPEKAPELRIIASSANIPKLAYTVGYNSVPYKQYGAYSRKAVLKN